jgi:hypothetical protein
MHSQRVIPENPEVTQNVIPENPTVYATRHPGKPGGFVRDPARFSRDEGVAPTFIRHPGKTLQRHPGFA